MNSRELQNATQARQVDGEVWLTSFTDLAALMLTFFVLQFSMSSIDARNWHGLLQGFHAEKREQTSQQVPWSAESAGASLRDSIPGRDLNYLASVLEEQLRAEGLDGLTHLDHGPGVLRLLLPASVFSDRPGADAGRLFAARRAIAGLLDRLENDIELVAFAVAPPDRLRRVDWSTALTKARSAAESLGAAGFDRPIGTSGRLLEEADRAQAQQIEILIHAEAEEGQ